VRDAYVLPLQGDAGGWDNLGAMDDLRSAMLATNDDIGTIDRLVRNASSTNATAVPATMTHQARTMRMTAPSRDPSTRRRRSQDHELAAAASKQCIQEHSSGVAAKQAAESEEISTPPDEEDEEEENADQDAETRSEEETLVGM